MSDLLPCPFCGNSDISGGEVLTEYGGRVTTQSMCRKCGALGPEAALKTGEVDYGSVKANDAWNRRAAVSGERVREALKDKRPCIAMLNGHTECGYPEDEAIHEGSTLPAPPLGRHKYIPNGLPLAGMDHGKTGMKDPYA